MEKTNNFTQLEKLVYDNPQTRHLRFTNIMSHSNERIFYYDLLVGDVVLLKRQRMIEWKNGTLSPESFPFSNHTNINIKEQPAFQKNAWDVAVGKANKMISLLEHFLLDKNLENSLSYEIEKVVNQIKQFFDLKNISNLNTSHNYSVIDMNAANLYEKLDSPKLFNSLVFIDKHKNPVYLLLEKIFYNFELLSKYKMTHTYIQVKNIDNYLVNHMKNIYFSQNFSIIDIEEETTSILKKINEYLTSTIDKYLEECIDQQISLMDSIHKHFTTVNEV